MTKINKNTLVLGALFMMTGVVLGAFGAHGLKEYLSDYGLDIYNKGVLYQFLHGISLILTALLSVFLKFKGKLITILFSLGILCFSGSLYLLAIFEASSWKSILGPITPIGGMLFIMGWLSLILSIIKSDAKKVE